MALLHVSESPCESRNSCRSLHRRRICVCVCSYLLFVLANGIDCAALCILNWNGPAAGHQQSQGFSGLYMITSDWQRFPIVFRFYIQESDVLFTAFLCQMKWLDYKNLYIYIKYAGQTRIQMILSVRDDCYIEHIGRKKKRDTCSLNSGSFSTASPFFFYKEISISCVRSDREMRGDYLMASKWPVVDGRTLNKSHWNRWFYG